MQAQTVSMLTKGQLSASYMKRRAHSKRRPVLANCNMTDLSPWRQVTSCLHGQMSGMLCPHCTPLLRTLHAKYLNIWTAHNVASTTLRTTALPAAFC